MFEDTDEDDASAEKYNRGTRRCPDETYEEEE